MIKRKKETNQQTTKQLASSEKPVIITGRLEILSFVCELVLALFLSASQLAVR